MELTQTPDADTPCFELRFRSLHVQGRGYAFPCDAEGHVDLNRLSDRARDNYLYARVMVGFELLSPQVSVAHRAAAPDPGHGGVDVAVDRHAHTNIQLLRYAAQH